MLSGTRSLARVPASGRSRPADRERERVGLALARRSTFERLVLTLLLVERMTATEVGAIVGLTAADVTRCAGRLLAGLRDAEPRPTRTATQRRKEA